MKKLKKVKKHWIAVGLGALAWLPMGMNSNVSAEEAEISEVERQVSEEHIDNSVQNEDEQNIQVTSIMPAVNTNGTTSSLNPDDVPGYDSSHTESLISDANLSQKVKDSITTNSRTVVAKPIVEGVNYGVHYDEENQWYYVKVSDFTNGQKIANQAMIQTALQVANKVVMQDTANTIHTGIAVKMDADVYLQRDLGDLSHYEVLTYGDGVPVGIRGSISGVADPNRITETEYAQLNVSADGLIQYKDRNEVVRTGLVLPIYTKLAHFEQITINQSLSNVRALYSDSRNPSRITTNLSQFGAMWDANENDTDARDHSVLLIDNVDGLLVKNIMIDILRPQLVAGQINDEFYKKGIPYYGKVSGITVNDSDNIRLNTINVAGANRAGIHFTSTYNQAKTQGTGSRLTSIEKLVASGQMATDALNMGRNNQVINSQLHHNRVAGLMFAYQDNFIAENNLVYDNGHPLSGSTGYGIASSAGSYNNDIHYRKNVSYRNYRKGLDIHDAENVNIVGNVSIGDRLNGISVYNRTFKMENVIIENNLVLQIPAHRLAKDDLSLDGRFKRGSDYTMYGAILLQTNEKNRDLSKLGSKGKFSISNNTIQGLSKGDTDNRGNQYVTEAIIIRMNEPYLDYTLDIEKNVILGESANAIIKMINSSYDSLNNNRMLPDFSKYDTALGLGSGTIRFVGNDIKLGSVYGNPDLGVSAFTFTESSLNTLVVETKQNPDGTMTTAHRGTGTVQNKFRGSLTFADNKIKFDNTNLSLNSKSEAMINILTNAEGVVFKDNQMSLGKVTGLSMINEATQAPLIRISGMISPTINSSFTHNASRGISNLPNSLRRTQPLIFLNNDIQLDSLTYGNNHLKAEILRTDGVVRYMANNDVSAEQSMRIGVASLDRVNPTLTNVLYTNEVRDGQPQADRDNRDFNLPRVRIGREDATVNKSNTERYTAPIQYIFSDNLLVGQYEVIQAGKDGEIRRTVSALTVDNSNRDVNSYDILKSMLPSHFNIGNVNEATDNKAVPGLLRADYIVSNGQVFTATKDYPYGTTRLNATPTTKTVNYRYENLPIGLKEATELQIQDEAIISESTPRIIVIGRGIPVYDTDRISEPIPYLKRYVADPEATAGERSVGQVGVEGERVNVYRVLRNSNTGAVKGSYLVESRLVRNPLEEIILIGTHEYADEEIPFKEEIVQSDTLFEGETRKEEGMNGIRRTSYLYDMNAETGLLGAKQMHRVTMITPVRNAITYVGIKPKIVVEETTELKELPFETITKYSDRLEEGQTLVEQEGEHGVLSILYKVTTNNQDANQNTREKVSETILKPARARILVIGSKQEKQVTREEYVTVPSSEVQRESRLLMKGDQRTIQEGKDGLLKVVYLDTLRLSDGSLIQTQEIARHVLVEMEERIILVGTKEHTDNSGTTKIRVVEEVIPYEQVYTSNSRLDAGESKILVSGRNGIRRMTYVDHFDLEGNLIASELISTDIVQEMIPEVISVEETTTPTANMLPATGEGNQSWTLLGLISLSGTMFFGRRRKSSSKT